MAGEARANPDFINAVTAAVRSMALSDGRNNPLNGVWYRRDPGAEETQAGLNHGRLVSICYRSSPCAVSGICQPTRKLTKDAAIT